MDICSKLATVAPPMINEEFCRRHFDEFGIAEKAWEVFYQFDWMQADSTSAAHAEGIMYKTWQRILLEQYFKRFVNRSDIWFKMWANTEKSGYKCIKPGSEQYHPLDIPLLKEHLLKKITISVSAINENGLSKWVCWDSDNDDGRLLRIEETLRYIEFNPIREAVRPGRDGHLWLLFDDYISADILLEFNAIILEASEIKLSTSDTLEFFPKSSSKHSQVRLPLGLNLKPSVKKRGWFHEPANSIETQISWLVNQVLDTADSVTRIVNGLSQTTTTEVTAEYKMPRSSNYSRPIDFENVDVRPLVGTLKKCGKEYSTACPLCRAEGRDNSGDNLRISPDGKRMNCVLGGPNTTHKTKDIYNYFFSL